MGGQTFSDWADIQVPATVGSIHRFCLVCACEIEQYALNNICVRTVNCRIKCAKVLVLCSLYLGMVNIGGERPSGHYKRRIYGNPVFLQTTCFQSISFPPIAEHEKLPKIPDPNTTSIASGPCPFYQHIS